MPLFQSNLRKQIRKLPKILQFVKIIHYYSELFTSLLSSCPGAHVRGAGRRAGHGGGVRRGAFIRCLRTTVRIQNDKFNRQMLTNFQRMFRNSLKNHENFFSKLIFIEL